MEVQAYRAKPPGFAAGDDVRRAVFGASLEQFDQLLNAAELIGPASSPIPLFYSFSQANRAIAAARMDGPDWRPSNHGLSVVASGSSIGESVLKPNGSDRGAFQMFCQAIGSGCLTGPVRLSALWAAVGRFRLVHELGANETQACQAHFRGDIADSGVFVEEPISRDLPADPAGAEREISKRLSDYKPGGNSLRLRDPRWSKEVLRNNRLEIDWIDSNGEQTSALEVVSPWLEEDSFGYVLEPLLGEQKDTIRPAAAMYACLLALSSLARYEPDAWSRALDRDKAETAIAIEDAIDFSLELLPFIVKELLLHSSD